VARSWPGRPGPSCDGFGWVPRCRAGPGPRSCLTGLPALLIIAGGAEALLSCAEQIATNACGADVDVHLSVYPEKVHGWMQLPQLAATKQATAGIDKWVRARLDPSHVAR